VSDKPKVYNFNFEKNRQKGVVTSEMLREHMDDWIESGKIKHMLVAYVYENENETSSMDIGYTNMNSLEIMGVAEWIREGVKDIVDSGDE